MNKSWSKTALLICLAMLLSILPRVWNLVEKPPLIIDEHANLKMLKEVSESGKAGFAEFHWDFSKTILSYYPTMVLANVLGSENGLLTLRLTSVIYGLLAIPPFYLIVKSLAEDKIAFLTTLLFSYNYFFLQFSRVGWVDITLVLTAGLYALLFLDLGLKALSKKSLFFLVISAIFSGLIFYAYRSGTIFIGIAFVYLVVSLYLKRFALKKAFKYLLIYIFTFTLIIAPWAIKISQNLEMYNLRARAVDIRNVNIPYHNLTEKREIFKYQITTSVKAWLFLNPLDGGGPENPRYLPLKVSPLNILIRLLFWIGGLIIIFNKSLFKKTYIWLLLILASVFAGQIMTVNPPNGARAIISLPSYYIISGVAFSQFYLKSGRNKFVLYAFYFLAFVFCLSDFYTYQAWMEWIKV
jgi:4-amino-4-deoxy-L-arabinose transferase-like glycosyltransferase